MAAGSDAATGQQSDETDDHHPDEAASGTVENGGDQDHHDGDREGTREATGSPQHGDIRLWLPSFGQHDGVLHAHAGITT